MREMYLPKRMGPSIGFNGVELTANEDRVVSVPDDAVETFKGHGLVDVTDEEAFEAALRADEDEPEAPKPAAKKTLKARR